jgi:transcriptional regulator with XRE-family HTH domain
VEKRLKRGLTQREVAERMGVPASVVSRLEREGSNPRLSTVVRYCIAVGCRLVVSVGKMDGVELFVDQHNKSRRASNPDKL